MHSYQDKDGMFNTKGIIKIDEWRMEELATTGISYIRPDGTWAMAEYWETTENALRQEHGYGKRVKYVRD